jgi:hypothetical protein
VPFDDDGDGDDHGFDRPACARDLDNNGARDVGYPFRARFRSTWSLPIPAAADAVADGVRFRAAATGRTLCVSPTDR